MQWSLIKIIHHLLITCSDLSSIDVTTWALHANKRLKTFAHLHRKLCQHEFAANGLANIDAYWLGGDEAITRPWP